MLNILVTGSNGQLGSEFKNISKNSDHCFIFTDRKDFDIVDKNKINDFLRGRSIDVILNCAAYTAVDKAEDEEEKAFLINHFGIRNLVEVCQERDIRLIHFSTDYVFNGYNYKPYSEIDEVSPQSIYGKSKFAGEQEIMKSEISALIIRTSWLYSRFGNNFLKSILSLAQTRDHLNIVYDQVGTPTHTKDLAEATLSCLNHQNNWIDKRHIYHFSNEGVASWYDFAKEIFEIFEIDCKVNPILSHDYPTKASRPHFSVFDKSRFKSDFKYEIRHWKDSLKELKFNINV
jgi:dTDP-4-dehydrorhamnose reductase